MKNYRINSFIIFFIIILILSSGYYKYKTEINYSINNLVNRIQPCQRPITYSINALDERFHLSKEELIIQTEKAQKIWGSTLNKDLFKYSENGEIKINLIYDYRQKATDELSKIGVVIDGGKTNLNTLKAKHDSYLESYNKEIAKINQMIAKYDSNKAIYDNDLRNWNNGTRQSNSEFNSIEQKRLNLNNEIALINKEKVISNELVKMINSNVTSINKVVNNFNLNVKNYNSIGSSTGKIFDE